jgi:hypothetical protein
MTIDWKRIDGIREAVAKEMEPYHDYHEGDLERMRNSIGHLTNKLESICAVLVVKNVISLDELREIL